MAPHLLHDLLDDRIRRPTAPAVTRGDRTLRYGELRDASLRLAGVLHSCGLRRGDRLFVTDCAHPYLPALLFAASRLGAVFTVVHEEVTGPVLRHILADCAPRLVVTGIEETGRAARDARIRHLTLDELYDLPAGPVPTTSQLPLSVDPVCLVYTSGTTALPKAVVCTHAQVVFAATAIGRRLRYTADDVVHCFLPLSFDYGLYQVFLCAAAGAHLHLGTRAEAGPGLLGALVRTGTTVLPAVPPVAAALLTLLRRRPGPRPPLRLLTNTGAAMPDATLAGLRAELPDVRVQLMYGLTECKRVSIMEPDEDLSRPGTVGRPLDGTEVFTVDADGNRQPPGAVGEITVRGPHVMAGYWRRPELTSERFVRREGLFPELRTGDYGSVDEDGYLRFAGRRDDIYKQDGFRVSAIEVEAAARRVPGVTAAAVLVPDADHPQAVLVVSGDAAPDTVLPQLRQWIENYKVPPRCVSVARLPASANGKTDKKTLTRWITEGSRV
ncbi:class I adenylate-forming enzyme family protein [Streptomyces sp. 7R007]